MLSRADACVIEPGMFCEWRYGSGRVTSLKVVLLHIELGSTFTAVIERRVARPSRPAAPNKMDRFIATHSATPHDAPTTRFLRQLRSGNVLIPFGLGGSRYLYWLQY